MANKGRPPKDPLDRFAEKLQLDYDTGCWLWIGGKSPAGYGIFINWDGRSVLAHRAAYEFFIGDLTSDIDLHHEKKKCPHRHCVNIYHVTPLGRKAHGEAHKNIITKCRNGHEFVPGSFYIHKGRNGLRRRCRRCDLDQQHARLMKYRETHPRKPHASSAKTHCKRGHEFTPENTKITVAGSRQCKECMKMLQKRWKDAHRKGVPRGTPKTHCKHNHEMTKENTYTYGGRRSCIICINERIKKSRVKKLAAKQATESPQVVVNH